MTQIGWGLEQSGGTNQKGMPLLFPLSTMNLGQPSGQPLNKETTMRGLESGFRCPFKAPL